MPPKRLGSPCVPHHRKKARVKVLQDTLSSTASTVSPSSFTRNFSIRRLSNGRKGQRRAKTVPCHDDPPATTVVVDGDSDDEDVNFEPTTWDVDNESATTPATKPRKNRRDTAKGKGKGKGNSTAVRSMYFSFFSTSSKRRLQNKTSIWLTHRDSILDELIRQDSRGIQDNSDFCGLCRASPGLYRCTDCSRGTLFCQACIIDRHTQLQSPLHRIEVCCTIQARHPRLTYIHRSGQITSSTKLLSDTLGWCCNSAMQGIVAPIPYRAILTSPSFTSKVPKRLTYDIVVASNLATSTSNSSKLDCTQRRSTSQERPSLSIA